MTDQPVRFLAIEDVLLLHRLAIEDQGGDPAIRDLALLESAMAAPRQQFDGNYAHPTIPAMAAAYAFHIYGNHPFADGNKRAAFGAMVAFLHENAWSLDADADEAEAAMLRLASGQTDKTSFTEWVNMNSHQKPSMELRDFVRNLDYQALASHFASVASASHQGETLVTIEEASRAIPAIAIAWAGAHAARSSGDSQSAMILEQQATLLTALFRIAEDMGYEW